MKNNFKSSKVLSVVVFLGFLQLMWSASVSVYMPDESRNVVVNQRLSVLKNEFNSPVFELPNLFFGTLTKTK